MTHEGFRVALMPVSAAGRDEHLLSSRWFYRDGDFPCLQLVWRDPQDRFPWQPGFEPEFEGDQPDLTESGWVRALVP